MMCSIFFNVCIGDMAPENISDFVESDVSQEEAKDHLNKHKEKIIKPKVKYLPLCLFLFYKGGGPASSSITDFQAVHWGSDILSDSGSVIVEAAVIAGAAPVAPDIVVDPLFARFVGEHVDLYAYAMYDPVGYSLLVDLWNVVDICFTHSEQSSSACMAAR